MKYKVELWEDVTNYYSLEVEANSPTEAHDIAWDQYTIDDLDDSEIRNGEIIDVREVEE